ncbi:hypothetical protein Taro_002969 [Colocasia esculenta]|uniref:Uncharacterized protein n=1 Tax=Colocasia esculenta TaxID=4460 RepID=A0A843TE66_COLES|nr:hypothetical protein [Colocasia esculenta]
MECSCKVLCRPCRCRLTLRLHSKPSWRLRKELMYGGLHYYVHGLRTARLMLLGTMTTRSKTVRDFSREFNAERQPQQRQRQEDHEGLEPQLECLL